MKNRTILNILFIVILSAITYLPLISRFGYHYDDWYLMASARAEGTVVFREIFSVDRPMRALVMIPAYTLFGANPLYYNLSAYIFRVAGALALFWLLNMLWQKQRAVITGMSLLFLLYPGFLSQPNGIDYQSHLVGLAAALTSVSLTIKAVLSENRAMKAGLHASSILLGWLYLGQMEWYIGFEFFRWACVFLLSFRLDGTFFQTARRAIQWAYLSLAVPGVFLIWRLFFFQSERGATDVGAQLSLLRSHPLQTIYHWTIQVAQDFMDVTLSAWAIPLSQLIGYIQRWGGILAIVAVGIILFTLHKLEVGDFPSDSQQSNFNREASLLGIFTIIGGLIPIAMVNRDVGFPYFSRYSLVSSTGVAILIVALLMRLNSRVLRFGIIAVLYLTAILTHHANTVQYANETTSVRNFWWQVAWRVPQFEKNTTLVAVYPGGVIQEDYFIWGPANLIYYPEKQNPKYIQPGLFAAIVNRDTVIKVLTRERQEYDKRKNIITYANYRNIVILTQPSPLSCVHIIDGTRPEMSRHDLDAIRVMSSYSEIEHVLVDEMPHTPPEIVFGPEPPHGWCFYYQKADLARQQGNWNEVIEMGQQAFDRNLSPADLIEWVPFLHAYALSNNVDRLTELAPTVSADPYISFQACRIIGSMPGLSAEVIETIDSL